MSIKKVNTPQSLTTKVTPFLNKNGRIDFYDNNGKNRFRFGTIIVDDLTALNIDLNEIPNLRSDVDDVSGSLVILRSDTNNLSGSFSVLRSDTDTLSGSVTNLRTDVDSLSGSVVFLTGDQTISGLKTFTDDVVMNSNLYVNGTEFIVLTEKVSAADNIIVINAGEVGPGVTSGTAGIEVDRGSLTNYHITFRESDDLFVIGEIGSLQAVATRDDSPTNKSIAVWNSSSNKFIDAGFLYDQASSDISTTSNNLSITIGSGSNTFIVDAGGSYNAIDITSGGTSVLKGSTYAGLEDSSSGNYVRVDATSINVNSNILPDVSGSYDLGSSSLTFQDLYLTTNGTIHFGNHTITSGSSRLKYDGQDLATTSDLTTGGGITELTTNTTFYCDPAGSDTTGDGSVGNPWRTIGHAANVIDRDYHISQEVAVTIKLNDGTYTITDSDVEQRISMKQANRVIIEGNTVTPANVVYTYNAGYSNTILLRLDNGTSLRQISGITFQSVNSATTASILLFLDGAQIELMSDLVFNLEADSGSALYALWVDDSGHVATMSSTTFNLASGSTGSKVFITVRDNSYVEVDSSVSMDYSGHTSTGALATGLSVTRSRAFFDGTITGTGATGALLGIFLSNGSFLDTNINMTLSGVTVAGSVGLLVSDGSKAIIGNGTIENWETGVIAEDISQIFMNIVTLTGNSTDTDPVSTATGSPTWGNNGSYIFTD